MLSWQFEQLLRKDLVAQPEALRILTRALTHVMVRPAGRPGPAGMFLLLGPVGSGKNELIRSVARVLGEDPLRVPRINAGLFLQAPPFLNFLHQLSQERARTPRPRASRIPELVVVENVESASSPVLDVLVHIFEHGNIAVANGVHLDFTGVLFVIRCTITEAEVGQLTHGSVGFAGRERVREGGTEAVLHRADIERLTYNLSARFFACVDEVIVLRHIEASDLPVLLGALLAQATERLARRGIELVVEPSARQLLVERGAQDLRYGVSALQRAVDELVETPLLDMLYSFPGARPMRVFVKRSFDHMVYIVPNLDPRAAMPRAEPPRALPVDALLDTLAGPWGHRVEIE